MHKYNSLELQSIKFENHKVAPVTKLPPITLQLLKQHTTKTLFKLTAIALVAKPMIYTASFGVIFP